MRYLVALLLLVASASATTITAASCSQANVQTAVNSAVSGDTVKTPGPCSNSWAARVDVPSTKGIILDGGGNTTLTKFGFTITQNATTSTFVTGFIFTNGNPASNTPTISVSGNGCSVAPARIHHNNFPITTSNNTIIQVDGNAPVLIDNNTFNAGINSDPNELIHNFGMNFGSNAGWTDDVTPGGPCMLFIEDNTFTFQATGNPANYFGSSAAQSYYGGRTVFRHNTTSMMQVDFHGTGGNVGARWGEVYENDFNTITNANQSDYIVFRGGSGVIFNNRHTGPNSGSGNIHLYEEDGGTWPRAYQDGSGINGHTDLHSTCSGGTRNQSPIYIWNNPSSFNVGTDGAPVNLNRDFFVSTSQPASLFRGELSTDTCATTYAYTPFTYPHPLQGGVQPTISLAPTSLTFSLQAVGTSSASQTVTLTNTASGVADLTVASVSLTGANSGDFSRTTTCTGTTIPAAGTCTITVTFTPAGIGARSAAVTIVDNATGSPHSIPLAGTGAATTASLTPNPLNFGGVSVGSTSTILSATFTNTGAGILTMNCGGCGIGISNSAIFSFIGTTCGTQLAPSASCSVQLAFNPPNTGSFSGTLTYTTDASNSPSVITLQGVGIQAKWIVGRAGSGVARWGRNATLPAGGAGADAYCAVGDVANFGLADGPAAMPTACVHTGLDGSPSLGSTITAGSTSAFATALTNAACGDTIVLTSGTTYTGEFVLPNKACDSAHWITIKTDSVAIPPAGTRATPCEINLTNDDVHNSGVRQVPGYPDYTCVTPGMRMPTINSGGGTQAAISVANGANHYRLIGLNIQKAPGSAAMSDLIELGEKQPTVFGSDHIIIDRCLIHGEVWANLKANEMQGGVSAQNSTYIAVVDSWIYDAYCISGCPDSQGYSAGTGPVQDGPHKIWNTLIASSGEAYLFGGGGIGVATPVTHNAFISNNHLMKPLTWMIPIGTSLTPPYDNAPVVKNNGEFKNCSNCLVENNYCERNWQGQSDQSGYCFHIEPRSQNNKVSATVNFGGTATVTAASGTPFTSSMGDPVNCPVGGCVMEIDDPNRSPVPGDDNVKYRICNTANSCGHTGFIDSTHVELTSAPPAGSGVSVFACPPGDSPGSFARNITIRYNYMRLVTNGIQISSGVSSHCADEASGLDQISIRDNVLEGASNRQGNGFDPDADSSFVTIGNGQEGAVVHDVTIAHNTAIIAETPSGSGGGFGVQVDHTDHKYLSNMIYRDNLSTEGLHVNHSAGSSINGGLTVGLQTQSCAPTIPNESPDGVRTVFNLSASLASYVITKNGIPQTPAGQTPTQFTLSTAPNTGDVLTARNLNACTYTFTSNALGVGLPGSGRSESPYPAGNSLPDATTFMGQFVNWNSGYGGDYRLCRTGLLTCLADSTYAFSASDSVSRSVTGKGLGADIDTLLTRVSGVAGQVHLTALAITNTTALTAATHGVAYSIPLTSTAGNSPFKEWTLTAGALPTGLALSRAGNIGLFAVLTVVRDGSGQSTVTVSETITGGAFVAGQGIVISGLTIGIGNKSNDDTFNGPQTITSLSGTNKLIFSQVGQPAVPSHNPTKGGTVTQVPTTIQASSFTVQARDGARQTATKALTLQVQ